MREWATKCLQLTSQEIFVSLKAFIFLWYISALFSHSRNRGTNNSFSLPLYFIFFWMLAVSVFFLSLDSNKDLSTGYFFAFTSSSSYCLGQVTVISSSETCGTDLIMSVRSSHWNISRIVLVYLDGVSSWHHATFMQQRMNSSAWTGFGLKHFN